MIWNEGEKLKYLEEWCKQDCFDDWEGEPLVKIEWIGNPGWHVQINLSETKLEKKKFNDLRCDQSDSDWIICKVSNGLFEGIGDLNRLDEILDAFITWAERNENEI